MNEDSEPESGLILAGLIIHSSRTDYSIGLYMRRDGRDTFIGTYNFSTNGSGKGPTEIIGDAIEAAQNQGLEVYLVSRDELHLPEHAQRKPDLDARVEHHHLAAQ